MSFWQLLALFRRLPVTDLLAYPKDIEDSRAVRDWVRAVLQTLDIFADLTDTEVDNSALAYLMETVDDDNEWEATHSIVVRLYQLYRSFK